MPLWTRCLPLALLAGVACSPSTDNAPRGGAGTSGHDAATPVCEPGADQTCNDNPTISSLHGTCLQDGTCDCGSGFDKNPATGRCL